MRDKAIYVAKAIGRRVVWAPADLLNGIRNGRSLPPRGLSFVGPTNFEQTGKDFLEHFVEYGGLSPDDRVLDMGCGIGRMAIPLTGYLQDGSYKGFDVGKEMIRWCQHRITPEHPSFDFTWAPIYNAKYNPFGTVSALEYEFPYPDDHFDFALATSLFTHMARAEVQHYLEELSRVLKPEGRAFLTFFLISPEAEAEIAAGRADFDFQLNGDRAWTIDSRLPEEAIAFAVDDTREMIESAGLAIREPIHHGRWANAPGAPTLQDIVVVEAPRG
ncbi:MAG TPA: methyltransferase domain-containing protein [Solirubrobacterales bacterium]